MTTFIDEQRATHGVEPICRTLAIAPSSYYAARSRPASARAVRDALVGADIGRIHRANYAVYGARKVWHALRREGVAIGRDQVGRVMRGLGLAGAVRGRTRRTTIPSELSPRPADLVERSSPQRRRIACGSPTSRTSRPGPASSTRPSSSTPSAARSSAGGCRSRSAPSSPSTPSRWRSGAAARPTSRGSSTTPTGGSVPRHPVHRAARRRGCGHLGWIQGRQLRQCPRRVGQRLVQDR